MVNRAHANGITPSSKKMDCLQWPFYGKLLWLVAFASKDEVARSLLNKNKTPTISIKLTI